MLLLWIHPIVGHIAEKRDLVVLFESECIGMKAHISQEIYRYYGEKADYIILPLPSIAYEPTRKRYWADKLIEYLNSIKSSIYNKVIGITCKDIADNDNWGIIGLGENPGIGCVISTYRLRTPNPIFYQNRILNSVIHELGHTHGLSHCNTESCLMQGCKNGKMNKSDNFTPYMCDVCKKLLG